MAVVDKLTTPKKDKKLISISAAEAISHFYVKTIIHRAPGISLYVMYDSQEAAVRPIGVPQRDHLSPMRHSTSPSSPQCATPCSPPGTRATTPPPSYRGPPPLQVGPPHRRQNHTTHMILLLI